DFSQISFSRVLTLDAAFRINFAGISSAIRNYFDNLCAKFRSTAVGKSYLIERQLQFGDAFGFSRSLKLRNVTLNNCAVVVFRIDYTRLEPITWLRKVGRNLIHQHHTHD